MDSLNSNLLAAPFHLLTTCHPQLAPSAYRLFSLVPEPIWNTLCGGGAAQPRFRAMPAPPQQWSADRSASGYVYRHAAHIDAEKQLAPPSNHAHRSQYPADNSFCPRSGQRAGTTSRIPLPHKHASRTPTRPICFAISPSTCCGAHRPRSMRRKLIPNQGKHAHKAPKELAA
jgi:hypothetical protein